MPAPYSTDLRQRVLNAYRNREGSQVQLAQRFSVSRTTVQEWLRCLRQSGRTQPLPHGGGHPPVFTPARQERLRTYVERHPDATLAEIRRWSRLSCCLETVSRTLLKMDLGRKKNAASGGTGPARGARGPRAVPGASRPGAEKTPGVRG